MGILQWYSDWHKKKTDGAKYLPWTHTTHRFKSKIDLLDYCVYDIYISFCIGTFSFTYFLFQLHYNLYNKEGFISRSVEAGCSLKYPFTVRVTIFIFFSHKGGGSTSGNSNCRSFLQWWSLALLDWPRKCAIFH